MDEMTLEFYRNYLKGFQIDNNIMTAPCPFCRRQKKEKQGRIVVYLSKEGFFHGYFRCLSRCVPGGFPLWFATLAGISRDEVPGYDPDREYHLSDIDYPPTSMNDEIEQFKDRLTPSIIDRYEKCGISRRVLKELEVGYNGRYMVFPYIREDGNCYSARCVFPDNPGDSFWHGDETFFDLASPLFNVADVARCENGALFLCEGEENLAVIRQLGFPGVAVHSLKCLEQLDPLQFANIRTLFLAMTNSPESEEAGRKLAERVGFKVRLLPWPVSTPKFYTLWQLACEKGDTFRDEVSAMLKNSRAFSPFASPGKEYGAFFHKLAMQNDDKYKALRTGFKKFDKHVEGVHGINIIGGPPKTGKSTFMIQAATDMALQKVPVLYYDFENGRQKIYQRTLSRLSRLSTQELRDKDFSPDEKARYDKGAVELKKIMHYFRVINDREVVPEVMRKHIDFIQHETRSDYTVVVIDSLHKLPFKGFNERRTGIDAWLRQMESIRDELQVSFLVISELTRGKDGSYDEKPHMGMFKGSGDIEYSADNAMIFSAGRILQGDGGEERRRASLWLVASREYAPGPVSDYLSDYPYWSFIEE